MGTVINDRPDFYGKCIDALKSLNGDVILSCGNTVSREKLGILPEHIRVYPYVDQLAVLASEPPYRKSWRIGHTEMLPPYAAQISVHAPVLPGPRNS